MDTYGEKLNHKMGARVREQRTASPEWEPEQYFSIWQRLGAASRPGERARKAPPRGAGA